MSEQHVLHLLAFGMHTASFRMDTAVCMRAAGNSDHFAVCQSIRDFIACLVEVAPCRFSGDAQNTGRVLLREPFEIDKFQNRNLFGIQGNHLNIDLPLRTDRGITPGRFIEFDATPYPWSSAFTFWTNLRVFRHISTRTAYLLMPYLKRFRLSGLVWKNMQ